MQPPMGRWLVALVGAIAIAIGIQHYAKALRGKYKQDIRYTYTAQRLDPLLKLGLIAHGQLAGIGQLQMPRRFVDAVGRD